MNRLTFFTVGLVGIAVAFVIVLLASAFQSMIYSVSVDFARAFLLIASVFGVFLLWLSLSISVQRLHDINWPTWYIVMQFIPFLNIGLSFILLFKKGTLGDNPYGPDPSVIR